MSGIEIAPATENDVPVVLEMIKGLAEYERLSHVVEATEERVRRTLFGPHPCAEVLLAKTGGDCAGFAVFFSNYSTFFAKPGIYLEDLFVKPDARGQGIGRALLKHLAQIAVERGCWRMEWVVLNWNEPALQFYKSLGAEAMNEWTTYRLAGPALERLAGLDR
jgi:GNAT superfamily N-acetyltransferase